MIALQDAGEELLLCLYEGLTDEIELNLSLNADLSMTRVNVTNLKARFHFDCNFRYSAKALELFC